MKIVNVLRTLIFSLLAAQMTGLHAAGAMEDSVLRFVRAHTSGIAGRVDIQIDTPEARLRSLACASFEPFLPAGARLWGRATIGVRCAGGGATVFVAVRIRVFAPAVVAVRPLAAGQILSADDLRVEETEVSQPGFLSRVEQAAGQRLSVAVNAGFPVKQEMIRQRQVVTQGDTVKLRIAGPGFEITAEGIASSHAIDGQSVQVRLESGRIVTGTARPGRVVEVLL